MGRIPLSIPNLCGREKEYVIQALDEQWVSTAGHYITTFEQKMASYLGVESCSACQSGTAGLHIALKLAGVEREDEVLVPTLTFIAAVNPVMYLNAHPVFLDCDEDLCMDSEKLALFLNTQTERKDGFVINKATGRKIKAILIVHVFGNAADLDTIMALAESFDLKVVEDATEALGTIYTSGKYKDKHAGTIGDFGVYSFNGNKIITTGGGGLLTARDPQMVEKAKYYFTQAKDDVINYTHHDIGYNYRMTSLQAAMGLGQLEKLEEFIEVKIRNYEHYLSAIETIPGLSLLSFNSRARSNHWFYSLLVDEEVFGMSRDQLQKRLFEADIETRTVWGLIHEQQPYRQAETGVIDRAVYYQRHILNLPCSSNLKTEDIDYVIKCIRDCHK